MSLCFASDSRRSADAHQERVADAVAERVVDVLEFVEIDPVQRERPVAAPRQHQLAPQLIGEQRAVRQAGERVMLRHVQQMLLGALVLGDVERSGQHADHGIAAVAQRRFGGEEHALIAAAVDDRLLVARQRLDRS